MTDSTHLNLAVGAVGTQDHAVGHKAALWQQAERVREGNETTGVGGGHAAARTHHLARLEVADDHDLAAFHLLQGVVRPQAAGHLAWLTLTDVDLQRGTQAE